MWGQITEPEQLENVYSRTRLYLVSEYRDSIITTYGMSRLLAEDISTEVAYLLDNDRFICKQETREVS